MSKPDTEALNLPGLQRRETAMERTTRAAREIIDDETEMRRLKNARLKQSRLENQSQGQD